MTDLQRILIVALVVLAAPFLAWLICKVEQWLRPVENVFIKPDSVNTNGKSCASKEHMESQIDLEELIAAAGK